MSIKTFDIVTILSFNQKRVGIVVHALPSDIPQGFDREATRNCSMVSVKPQHPSGPRVIYYFLSEEYREQSIRQLELCGYVARYSDEMYDDD